MSQNPALYQAIDLKIYASTEWLADNKKKYRTVFEVEECTYVYCEFSFYNLKFKEADWNLNLKVVCIDNENNELCNLNCDRIVSQDDNIIYVREGWGTKNKGTFWKPGIYKWQAHIDGTIIIERPFYIQSFGKANDLAEPYFKMESLKLYEGPDANVKLHDRTYYSVFNFNYTRYVWVELNAKNLIKDVNYWACELTFNFRTSNHLLKGSITKLFFVYPQDNEFSVTIGWGSDKVGTWGKDDYIVDVLFMDQLLVTKVFTIGDDYVEATTEDFLLPESFGDFEIETLKDS